LTSGLLLEENLSREVTSVRTVFILLSLIAALSGPFLRQAEGAEDLARSLAELGCAPLVEEVDGGVGDDAGLAITSSRLMPSGDLSVPGDPGKNLFLFLTTDRTDLGGSDASGTADRPLSRFRPLLELSWLQRFLF
jgi:hypothetical protein